MQERGPGARDSVIEDRELLDPGRAVAEVQASAGVRRVGNQTERRNCDVPCQHERVAGIGQAVAEYDEALRRAGCGRARLRGEQCEETHSDDSLQNTS